MKPGTRPGRIIPNSDPIIGGFPMIRSLLLAAVLLPFAAQAASSSDRWLHVSIDGTDEDPERVRINVPLKLVHSLEPLWESHDISDDLITINGKQLTRQEIAAMLKAVREADEGEYISVIDDDEHVRVAKEKNRILVHVIEKEKKGKENRVEIRIPIAVVEALLSGDDGDKQLNLVAALEELGRHNSGELVAVDDEGERVRIWVDGKNESD